MIKRRVLYWFMCLAVAGMGLVALVGAVAGGLPATAPHTPRAAQGTYLTVTPVDVTANDLLYDAGRDVVYATVPSTAGVKGNSVVRISPSGAVGPALFVGSEPHVMAQSGDGQYLYIGIDGAAAFRRVDLTDDSLGPLWPLGSGFCGNFTAEDMVVLGDDAHAVAISLKNSGCSPGHEGVAVFDDGVKRPETTQSHTGSNALEPSDDPAVLYGYTRDSTDFGFRLLAISEDGITETQVVPGLVAGHSTDIHYVDGLVYATDGHVVNPQTLALAGTYAAFGPLAVDTDAGVVTFAAPDFFGPPQLKAFDLDTFLPLYSVPFTPPGNEASDPVELLAVGDAFFVRLGNGRVLLLRTVAGAAISGRVTDQYGYGVAEVEISTGAGHTTVTDYEGYYTLAPLPDGVYTLSASHDRYRFEPSTVEVTVPPDAAEQDFLALTVWGMCLPVVQR